jgi:hypothetical protein
VKDKEVYMHQWFSISLMFFGKPEGPTLKSELDLERRECPRDIP